MNNSNNTNNIPVQQQSAPVQTQNSYVPFQPGMNPQQYVPYVPIKKEYKPFSKRDNTFLFLFLAAAFLLVDFAVFKGFRLGFTISYYILFVISTVFLWNKEKKPTVFSLLCGVVSLAGGATFTLYSDDLMKTFMVVLMGGLFTLYCIGISGSGSFVRGNFKMLFDLFTGVFTEPFENMGDIIGSIKATAGKGKKRLSGFLGVLLAIPVLVIIVPLLIKSDAAFEGMISAIAKNIGIYLLELAIAVVILPYLFSYMFGKRYRLNKKENTVLKVKKCFPASGCISFLSMISITYVIYLVSQLAYFFSAFKGILPEGYTRTASEFARRGFYETFAVCAINVLMISVISAFTKRKDKKLSPAIKVLSLFISLVSVLMIATAIQKMRLNISTYGFTRNRLLVFVFMLMMLVVIGFFIIHIFAPKVSYMQPIILICSVMFVALSFMNIDDFTYENNLRAYKNGTLESFDMYTVSTLEPSEKYYIDLAKGEDKVLAHKAVMWFIQDAQWHETYTFTENGAKIKDVDFRSYSVDREEARRAVKSYYNALSDEKKKEFMHRVKLMEESSYEEGDDTFYRYNEKTDKNETYVYNAKTDCYELEKNN